MQKQNFRAVVALLRGVNLGGTNRVQMDALREMCEGLGLREPKTYLQSGNVVFGTAEQDLVRLGKRMEKAIEAEFGFRTDVILRTGAEMEHVVARNPFAKRRGIDPSKLLVTFLAGDPDPDAREQVRHMKADPEELYIDGREVYIYFPNGMARPKLSWVAIAKTLKTQGTGRNWNSVIKLLEMAQKMNNPGAL